MGEARGCRGGSVAAVAATVSPPVAARRACAAALRGTRLYPRHKKVCAPVPSRRRSGGPCPSSALPLNRSGRPRLTQMAAAAGGKSLRARGRVPLRPPCALAAPVRRGSGGGRPLREVPAVPLFSVGGGQLLRGHSAAVAPAPGLAAASRGGGACFRRGAAAPASRPAAPPRPPVLYSGGGAVWFALRRFCPRGGAGYSAAANARHYILWCISFKTALDRHARDLLWAHPMRPT